ANGYSGVLNCSSECGDTLDVSGGLAAAIKGLLYGDPTRPDPILLADLAGFVALDANGDQFSVTDLSGLECWTHLETLYLDNNQFLTDISQLQQLTQLRELDLSCSAVASLDALADHPTLEYLDYSAQDCSSVLSETSALSTISSLNYLDLSAQGLTSLAGLSSALSLQVLLVSDNELTSLNPVATLPVLRHLIADRNNVTNISSLTSAAALEQLSVAGNGLTSIDALGSLPHLVRLRASGNSLDSTPDFSGITTLRGLFLSNNQLSSVETFAALDQIMELDVAANEITTHGPHVGSPLGGQLVIAGNPLPCATEASNIPALQTQGIDVVGCCQGNWERHLWAPRRHSWQV